MTVNDQHVLILFRIHCGLAQAQFDAANPSVLNLPYVDIVSMVVDGCRSLGLLNYEEESEAFEMTAEDLNRRILDRTERTFPRLVPVGELAQVATIRLLYRGTKMEESDMSEIMALELTAMFAAKKIGIHDEIFMEWHRSMFDDDANPQSIMQSLETIVRDSLKALCIFLSYRRDDTELFVGRISDRLVSAGYDVIYDVNKLEPGAKWRDKIKHYVSTSDILMAVIGENWSSHRLFHERDAVRMEIATAFNLQKNVLPILVNKAKMPIRGELPPDLAQICEVHATKLETGRNFDEQMMQLLKSLESLRWARAET